MISTLVFEVTNVFLTQPEEVRLKLWNSLGLEDPAAVEEKRMSGPWWDAYIRGRLSEEDYWNGIIQTLPFDFQANWRSLSRLFERTVWLDTDLVSRLQTLKKSYQIVALANGGPEIERRLDHFNLSEGFDQIFVSYKLGMAKPDPAIYSYLTHAMGAKPDQTLFIDSDYISILKARECHYHPYLFTNGHAFQRFFIASQSNQSTLVLNDESTTP